MDHAQETIDQIVDMAFEKIVDWGQDTPIGMVGVGEAVAAKLTENVAQLKSQIEDD